MSSVIVAKASVILAFKFVISRTGVENILSLTYPHKKKSRGVISGDRGGQGVGPSLPIHLFGNVVSKNRRKSELQCGGAPSCWKIIHGWNSSEVQRKVPTCPGGFLVINVCNQGKNLCSPCVYKISHCGREPHVITSRSAVLETIVLKLRSKCMYHQTSHWNICS